MIRVQIPAHARARAHTSYEVAIDFQLFLLDLVTIVIIAPPFTHMTPI